jgi:hypothetical protein
MLKPIFIILCGFLFGATAAISVAAQTSRTSVSGAEVTGTFKKNFTGKYRGNWNEIRVLALGKGKIRIGMDLTYPYTMADGGLMANTGELDGEAAIAADTAVYTSEDGQCRITIKFARPGTINVKQDGADADCGFGNNVNSSGTYRKASSAKPKFTRE